MKKSFLVFVSSVVIGVSVYADTAPQKFLTAKIMVINAILGGSVLSNNGDLFYSAVDLATNNQDVFAQGVNLSSSILGANRFAKVASGAPGIYAWSGNGSATSNRFKAFVGTTDIAQQYVGSYYWASVGKVGTAGAAWQCMKTSTSPQDVYKDGTVLSYGLGNNRNGLAVDINNSGDVLWYGKGYNNGQNYDMFINTTNYSQSILGGSLRKAVGVDLNNHGVPAWFGYGASTGGKDHDHAFKGTTDVSAAVIGADKNARSYFINDANQLLWMQYGTYDQPNGSEVWLDNVNISAAVLGTKREGIPWSLNERGDILWTGKGGNLDAIQDVFFNTTNLSKSVLGSGRASASAVTMNENGWVVWQIPTAAGPWEIRVSMPQTQVISGHVDLELYQGDVANAGLKVNVIQSDTGWNMGDVPATVDSNGNFTLELPRGTFDLTYKVPHYLRKIAYAVDTLQVANQSITLLGGDADGNNQVDLFDLNILFSSFSGPSPDMDGDGVVGVTELNMVFMNFLKTGDA